MSTHLLKDHKSEIADDTVYQVSCSCVNCVSYLPFYHAPWGLLHIHSSSLKSPLNSRAVTVCEDVSLPSLSPCTVRVDIETRLHDLVASLATLCGISRYHEGLNTASAVSDLATPLSGNALI